MTTTTHIPRLDHSVDITNVWLGELAAALGTDDRQHAYRILRSFLHTLRDGLSVGESADLVAQLPIVLRGVYFQDWQPHRYPRRYRNQSAFLRRFAEEARLENEADVQFAAIAALGELSRHVSIGEVGDLMRVMPPDVCEILSGLKVQSSS